MAIYCNPDYIHILIDLHRSVSDAAKYVKANSSKWVNEQNWIPGKFNWQEGFGAFSYSKSQVDVVVKYILNQAKLITGYSQIKEKPLNPANLDLQHNYRICKPNLNTLKHEIESFAKNSYSEIGVIDGSYPSSDNVDNFLDLLRSKLDL